MTTTTVKPPATNGKPLQQSNGIIASATRTGPKLAGRLCLHAAEKWGKTSFAAYASNPFFLCSRGETGIATLIDNGQLAELPFAECQNASDASRYVNALIVEDHDRKTLIVDTANGASRMFEEDVCQKKFGGDWGPNGYGSYGAGIKASTAAWNGFIDDLDRLRQRRNMSIILLCHSSTKKQNNPAGEDYEKVIPAMPEQLWTRLNQWCDQILYGTFVVVTEKEGTKRKGRGGTQRIIYANTHAAYIAGGRYNLPEQIDCGDSAAEAWRNFAAALKAGKTKQPVSNNN
jgi:AAA domain-containing protein